MDFSRFPCDAVFAVGRHAGWASAHRAFLCTRRGVRFGDPANAAAVAFLRYFALLEACVRGYTEDGVLDTLHSVHRWWMPRAFDVQDRTPHFVEEVAYRARRTAMYRQLVAARPGSAAAGVTLAALSAIVRPPHHFRFPPGLPAALASVGRPSSFDEATDALRRALRGDFARVTHAKHGYAPMLHLPENDRALQFVRRLRQYYTLGGINAEETCRGVYEFAEHAHRDANYMLHFGRTPGRHEQLCAADRALACWLREDEALRREVADHALAHLADEQCRYALPRTARVLALCVDTVHHAHDAQYAAAHLCLEGRNPACADCFRDGCGACAID